MTEASRPGPDRRRTRLRTRIVVRIGILVAGLSIVLGVSTYYLVSNALIDEREQSTSDQFSTNAIVVAAALRTSDVDEVALLSSLRPEVRARELLFNDGEWFSASLQVQPDDLPAPLVRAVRSGQPARQRFTVGGSLVVALGTPIENDSLYFEVFSLESLRNTLATLRNTLVIVGTLATLGGMVLAAWIGRRIAGPLERVGLAAAGIADGDLSTRLHDDADEEVAQIATSFNRMADSLEERIERESRFAADVSHELRSPLTTLVNTVSVLEHRRAELSPEADEALTLLAGDVKRFERMVADLIEISKLDAGSARIEIEDAEATRMMSDLLRRHSLGDVAAETTPVAVGVFVSVDLQRFGVVLRNVLENATAYAGGATRVTIDADDETVAVAIEDDGPGVAHDERQRIFERFSRGVHGERRMTADGSGLGLSLARENLATMGGTIRVEDGPDGHGARFVITLPRADR